MMQQFVHQDGRVVARSLEVLIDLSLLLNAFANTLPFVLPTLSFIFDATVSALPYVTQYMMQGIMNTLTWLIIPALETLIG